MLSLAEKRKILQSFEELREKENHFGRFFYYYDKSPSRKKIVAREFVSSGNGYVFGKYLTEYHDVLYQDGSVCVKNFSADELRSIVKKAIDSLNKN
ncbi:hypothetical protein JOC95_001889 [Bacillus tianshenii]|uniref:Uncharacterized protein n=1 Tax=Sutcliffiella tianshenii TaxID=1463404 RepID=A0ABS2NZB0_9BACI|nr:hypothetical protein [Bacillus tianshenii]MBM7620037.1 hypothetical protein [Bacillus tianshenii]